MFFGRDDDCHGRPLDDCSLDDAFCDGCSGSGGSIYFVVFIFLLDAIKLICMPIDRRKRLDDFLTWNALNSISIMMLADHANILADSRRTNSLDYRL
jgi:hypothetical protein